MEYDLDGWFFFGSLLDSETPQDPGVFFISMQRVDVSEDGGTMPLVPAVVAYGSEALGQYVYGGAYTLDLEPAVNVLMDPCTPRHGRRRTLIRFPVDQPQHRPAVSPAAPHPARF